ncbi:MAG: ABC transporter substrate-binding protein [Frankiales bacterium]|nr:ABC transporter substrate-binding protein [Frankiales bacterium]
MTSARTGSRLFTGLAVLALLTSACGLKQQATDSLKSSAANAPAAAAPGGAGTGATGAGGAPVTGGTTTGGSTGSGVVAGGPTGTGSTGTGTTTTGGSTGSTGSGNTGGNTGSGGGSNNNGGGTPTGGGPCGVPSGGTTTGVTASTINIGLHAPLTGTGTPFPNSSFQKGAGTFWQQPGHTICGRKVNVEFQDDTYKPDGARSVCSAMAKRDFLVLGGGGTDQIQACATDPDIQRLGVPYLSAGVTDNGLTGLNNYFAVSLTYAQQGELVLRNAQQQHIANPAPSNQPSDNIPGKKAVWAVVTANSPNFAGARNGMMAALNAAHIPYKHFERSQQGNYQAAATQFGQQLALDGFKTIFFDAAPGYFLFTARGYYNAHVGTTANWVGPGVTYTEVTVAQLVCSSAPQMDKHAWFLAPGPGLDHATQDFKKAYGGKYDDIEWSLWGLSQSIYTLLKDADSNLTRQNFIASTEHAIVPSNAYAPLDYVHHGGHFGGTGAWVQRMDCGRTEPNQNQAGTWDTVGSHYLSLY